MPRHAPAGAPAALLALAFALAAAATPAAALAACGTKTPWTTFGGDNARTGENPCEDTLGAANVGTLQLLWSAPLSGPYSIVQPTYAPDLVIDGVAHDVLFVGDEHGVVQALDAATGAQLWARNFGKVRNDCVDIPDGIWGVSGAPVLDLATGTGYLVSAKDQVVAIDLATGKKRKGWKAVSIGKSKLDHVYGSLTMAGGRLYAATASYCDVGTYFGHVDAVDIASHAIAASWDVVAPDSGHVGGGIWGPGGVSIDDADGSVYAATGNSFGPEDFLYAEHVVQLDADLAVQAANEVPLVGGDVDYGATPLLFQPPGCPAMVAAKNKSGVLVVYDRDTIANGPKQTLQVGSNQDFQFNGIPAYSAGENRVYVSNSSDSNSDVFQHGMVAFDIANDCTLALAWQQTVGPSPTSVSPPTVANGVVYYGDGGGNTLRAFDASSGAPLWNSGSTISGPVFAAPLVADGRVVVTAWDGHVYAFGLPPP